MRHIFGQKSGQCWLVQNHKNKISIYCYTKRSTKVPTKINANNFCVFNIHLSNNYLTTSDLNCHCHCLWLICRQHKQSFFWKYIFPLFCGGIKYKQKIIVSILLRSCWLKICEDRWWCVSWLSVATKPQIDNKTELATCDYSHTSS